MAILRLPMKSKLVRPSNCVMLSLVSQRFRSASSNTTREQKIAVNNEVRMPRIRMIAKPRRASVPIP